MTLSYLVATAGHAQHQNEQHPHNVQSILQLLDEGADEFEDETVVGFADAAGDGWACTRLSFREIQSASDALAGSLLARGVPQVDSASNRVVSLLCPTGPEFLLAWVALMRLGYGVVFIAPQCSPAAVASLLASTDSTRLVYHARYAALAEDAKPLASTVALPTAPEPSPGFRPSPPTPSSVSHVFHTSGTSGNPKPVPHSHRGSVAILPRRRLPSYLSADASYPPAEPAAFTTTPLFHGGVSDLLRAWMARGMIYFYPTSTVPVTAGNVVAAVAACGAPADITGSLDDRQLAERRERFRVAAFLSVPYILTVLAEDDGATAMLATLDMVSTGGAPLDSAVGAGMVRRGVRLVSRLGSSECGFLLSSHRDYATEDDWEWLRNDSPYADAIRFEPSGDGSKCEMVVTPAWRSKTKTNRDDGSYATGDLYEPHGTKANVWRYAGRADDVIVMSNGEKASPGPIETVFRSSPAVADALVVGVDRAELGVLVFARAGCAPDIPALLDEANRGSPSFAQIAPGMCTVVQSRKALPKSSKGTVQRGLAYDVFRDEIAALYGTRDTGDKLARSLGEIEAVVRELLLGVAPRRLKPDTLGADTDLFSWGVDSLMATRVRAGLQARLDTGGTELPLNVVFERPSLSMLSRYIHGLQEKTQLADSDPHRDMQEMVEKYGDFSPGKARATAPGSKTVLLTGSTGSLGSFLAHDLGQRRDVARVVCLVRAETDEAAKSRLAAALDARGLQRSDKLEAVAADLAAPNLGLPLDTYRELAESADLVIHAAWPVHFASTLGSFDGSVKGARQLIDLARDHARFFFLSSLASVLAGGADPVVEDFSDDPSTASPIGYSRSKWVTEAVCRRAEACAPGRVHVLRIGQLCGDTTTGHWNEKEGWPLLVRTAQTAGCLPALQEAPSWLPVDQASRAVVDIVLGDARALVYHVAHPQHIHWATVLDSLRAAGLSFEAVPPADWVRRVEASDDERTKQMLPIWAPAYTGAPARDKTVDVTNACAASSLRTVPAVGREQIIRMVAAWRKTGFL